jgi:HD-like signal output (HDOD) protein
MRRDDQQEDNSHHAEHERVHKRMGELLLEAGVVTQAQLAEALQVQQVRGARLVETLIALNYMKPAAFVDFLARQPGVASIDLLNYTIPPEVIRLVPREMALRHEVFPIDQLGRLLTLGMACPLDAAAIAELESTTGLRVKAMLCSATDIRAAIQRYYPRHVRGDGQPQWTSLDQDRQGLGSAIKLQSAARLVRQMRNLPVLPETVDAVRVAMLTMSTTPAEVVAILQCDPAIVAKVLSVANSPAYGFPGHVNDLNKALVLMGLRETYAVVLSASIMHVRAGASAFDYRAFWISAMTCAGMAGKAAELSGLSNVAGAYWGGLLHDVGCLVLVAVAPDLYGALPKGKQGADLIAAEEDLIGLAHTEAGFELAVDWNLPIDIAEAIRFHHAPELATGAKDTVAAVALAETLMCASDREITQAEQALCDRCAGILNVGKADRKAFLTKFDGVKETRRHWAHQWERLVGPSVRTN